MSVCSQQPPDFAASEQHRAACWLQDPKHRPSATAEIGMPHVGSDTTAGSSQ